MADLPENDSTSGSGDSSQDASGAMECPICLQPCMHPVELPCRHVFCFLCIKGVAMQGPNSKCAICRAQVPYSVLTNPQLKDVSQLYKEPKLANGYQWYYESRGGGWWQYDERTMNDLEREFSSNKPTCQLLLAGHLYVVDFTQMIQYRLNNRTVSRRIKREQNLAEAKRGVAGIRISGNNTGAGSSAGANNGSPPPAQQGSAATTRRRRGNPPAAPTGTAQPPPASGHNLSSVTQNPLASSARPPANQSSNGDSPMAINEEEFISDSDDDESVEEDEDYDSDYSEADEDMEIGEEEEALIGDDSDERETEDEEDYEARDGARAPTRRSDRSNSSNNQTPPPPSGAGVTNGASGPTYSPNPNGRGSRSARSGRSSGSGRSSNGTNGTSSRSGPVGSSEPFAPVSSSASSNILLLTHRYNEDNVTRNNISNNNIYLPLDHVGQVSAGSISSITNTTTAVKITFERSSQRVREEYL